MVVQLVYWLEIESSDWWEYLMDNPKVGSAVEEWELGLAEQLAALMVGHLVEQ